MFDAGQCDEAIEILKNCSGVFAFKKTETPEQDI